MSLLVSLRSDNHILRGPEFESFLNALTIKSFRFKVDFSGTGISDEEAELLAKAIVGGTRITTLLLNSNNIGDRGAISLANVIRSNVGLAHLNLGFNVVSDNGALELIDAARYNSSFKRLVLGNNCISEHALAKIRSSGMTSFVDIISNDRSKFKHVQRIVSSCTSPSANIRLR